MLIHPFLPFPHTISSRSLEILLGRQSTADCSFRRKRRRLPYLSRIGSRLDGRAGEDFSRIWRAAACLAGEPARISRGFGGQQCAWRENRRGYWTDGRRPAGILETSSGRRRSWRRARRGSWTSGILEMVGAAAGVAISDSPFSTID